ncbi:folylpolyglutamate synthase/dihydrofolate synthase family protein [Agrococcus sp. ARC_14]|uniref:bifunctional folylpolyglutamate synthase/dihydrofolate synthase n=1 Tax=Agrococcus sp. ARC_14 TaxID=2919927 RepID=UPI001F0574E2|nr:folylpolyglutamate synthase/dihydrofolate synthase family protein [Agrococcus sp. ARC_14]MCH1883404.1 bifunctional folylpolyglutamate synthase/dihydrofolate synthase [Agrococcus sp. ARC_14]
MSDELEQGTEQGTPDIDDRILASLEHAEAAEAAYQALLERAGEQAVEPRIEATRRAVELLGDPQRSFRIIHITGTNGKGSTARIADALLRAHGLRTGMLTSPHLERVNERITIDGEPVSDEAFARNYEDIAPFLDLVDAELAEQGERRLTFFEAFTVLAFAVMADAPVDVAVLEVGMGGTWDSTNVADGDVAVITPIALDHTNRLGSTVEAIAREKAGIIKPDAIVVSAQQQPEALAVLEAKASEVGARLLLDGRDFSLVAQSVAVGGQLVTVKGLAAEYIDQLVPLMGAHQGRNAELALVAVEAFLGGGTQPMTAEVLADGFAASTSPGRLDVIGADPLVIADAAHNPHGAAALRVALGEYFGLERITLVLGVLAGKDVAGVLAELEPVIDELVVTQSTSERALDADALAAQAVAVLGADRVLVEPDLSMAVEAAREAAADRSGAVVVTGSITLLGDVIGHARETGWLLRPDARRQAATVQLDAPDLEAAVLEAAELEADGDADIEGAQR